MTALRAGLIRVLSMLEDSIEVKQFGEFTIEPAALPSAGTTNVVKDSTERMMEEYYENNSSNSGNSGGNTGHQQVREENTVVSNLEKDLQLTLGLLLKHRGGPGFGHGRLQGKELSLLEEKLRSTVSQLRAEVEV